MNIIATDEDIAFVREAERLRDWHVLTSWKQRFIYQRYVALPRNDIATVKEIAAAAKEKLTGYRTREKPVRQESVVDPVVIAKEIGLTE